MSTSSSTEALAPAVPAGQGGAGTAQAPGSAGTGSAAGPDLANTKPLDVNDPVNTPWLRNLQGNILSGHGRDHTVHIFLKLPDDPAEARALTRELAGHITSAHKQETERHQFKTFGIPGSLFGNLLLSASGYRALGFADDALQNAFKEEANQPRPTASNFLDGMARHAVADLGDQPPEAWEFGRAAGDVDLMLLLADDDEGYLSREARRVLDSLEGRCVVQHIERGTALRNDEGEGIEHFGYVDGRSQPLLLAADFEKLEPDGSIGSAAQERGGGRVDSWNPFEPLSLALLRDPLAGRADCLGSYFVFRKLEQNVRDFIIEEQRLADALGLVGQDRERAGAMAVGRFRDGTPLVLSQTDGLIPPKENNFRYDQQDEDGLKCPFHAHIRKTNPRGDIGTQFGAPEAAERSHRILRRGIPYGGRNRHPNAFQALDDLPSSGVGLLFMCFQASIRNGFAFMQRGWANNQSFVKNGQPDIHGTTHPLAGLDPIIGQLDRDQPGGPVATVVPPTWRPDYGLRDSERQIGFGRFVTMKGGEFFFAPSIPFLKGLSATA